MGGIKDPLTTGQVADYLKMSVEGVNKWIREKKLKAFRTPGGKYRVEKDDFRYFLEDHNLPVDEEYFGIRRRRILLLDDDENLLQLLTWALEDEDDLEIHAADDPLKGIYMIGSTDPDLVIVDLRMPDVDGLAVCRAVAKEEGVSRAKFVILSAYLDDETRKAAEQIGVAECVSKPINQKDFRSLVHRHLSA